MPDRPLIAFQLMQLSNRYNQEVANRVEVSLLKIFSQQKLEQVRKPGATSRDEPTRAADSISGCRAIQI